MLLLQVLTVLTHCCCNFEYNKRLLVACVCRVWGEHGQAALELARVCVLNCGPTGSEALKNLVLGGIGSFTIVDASKVSASDLGNNYLGELPLTRPLCLRSNLCGWNMQDRLSFTVGEDSIRQC